MTTITAHPRLATLGIGLAVTFAITIVIGTAIGILDRNQAFAIDSIFDKSKSSTKD
ncbi:MAG: hypothetical protein ACTHKJ_02975 [Candidatus Nitrosocosmicus sp.]